MVPVRPQRYVRLRHGQRLYPDAPRRETYLLLAEAQFKQGKLDAAATSINALRERAFPTYPAVGKVAESDITLDFILDERA